MDYVAPGGSVIEMRNPHSYAMQFKSDLDAVADRADWVRLLMECNEESLVELRRAKPDGRRLEKEIRAKAGKLLGEL